MSSFGYDPDVPAGFQDADLEMLELAALANEERPPAADPIIPTGNRCDRCGEPIDAETWIYSRHTGARYCGPGAGCNVNREPVPTAAPVAAEAEGRLF